MGYKDQFEDGIIMDQPRIDYLRVYLESLSKAITAGVNVKDIFVVAYGSFLMDKWV